MVLFVLVCLGRRPHERDPLNRGDLAAVVRRFGRMTGVDDGARSRGCGRCAPTSSTPRSLARTATCRAHRQQGSSRIGSIIEAVRCAITIQNAMIERNIEIPGR